MLISAEPIFRDLSLIREQAPLIHNITNFVVMNQTANALLALGASPIMAHAQEELADLLHIAKALVINIGTLDSTWINSIKIGLSIAKIQNLPIVFDPVGAGASQLRTQTCQELISLYNPSVIRGNASEISALANSGLMTKGVESTESSLSALTAAKKLTTDLNCAIVISGKIDICLTSSQQLRIHNGTPLMTRVTGMGCTATCLIAAFCAVNTDYLQAATHAMAVMNIAGEIAEQKSTGPGSLQSQFYDALYNLTEQQIAKRLNCEEVAA